MKTGQKILGMLCLCTMASMGFASKYSSSKFSETEMCGGNAVYQQALDDMRRYVKIDDKKALSKMLRYPFWVIIEDRGIEDKSQGSCIIILSGFMSITLQSLWLYTLNLCCQCSNQPF